MVIRPNKSAKLLMVISQAASVLSVPCSIANAGK